MADLVNQKPTLSTGPSSTTNQTAEPSASLHQETLPSFSEPLLNRALDSILSETSLPRPVDAMTSLARHGEVKIGDTTISVELVTAA